MSRTEDGQRAITQLNATTLGERAIIVNEEHERQNTSRRSNYRSERA